MESDEAISPSMRNDMFHHHHHHGHDRRINITVEDILDNDRRI